MLAGHSGYLTGAYRRYTKKQLAEEYLKGQHLLTIQAPKELQEIESEFKAKIQTHEGILTNIVKENIELKTTREKHTAAIEELKKQNERLEKEIEKIQSVLKEIAEDMDNDTGYIIGHRINDAKLNGLL